MTPTDNSPWQRPSGPRAPRDSAASAKPTTERNPFASSRQTTEVGRSPWARPEAGAHTDVPRATSARTAEVDPAVQSLVAGGADLKPVSKPASALDRRSMLLLAILPCFALGMLNELYLEPAYRLSKVLFYLADAVQFVVVPMLVWFLVLRPANIRPKDFGLRWPIFGTKPFETAGLFLFAAFLLWTAYALVDAVAYGFLPRKAGVFGYGSVIPKSFPFNALVIIYFSLTAALVEEVVFRGLTWRLFSSAVPTAWLTPAYIIISSILFAVIHTEQGLAGMISAFAFGLVAAALYASLKNLWPLVFGHFVCDVISFWPK